MRTWKDLTGERQRVLETKGTMELQVQASVIYVFAAKVLTGRTCYFGFAYMFGANFCVYLLPWIDIYHDIPIPVQDAKKQLLFCCVNFVGIYKLL